MKESTNIKYSFLKRSSLQFRQDLSDISLALDSLSEEQIMGVKIYVETIKNKIKHIEDKIARKLISFDSDNY
jgi:hypothetical protein